MKKIVFGAALVFAIGLTQAAPISSSAPISAFSSSHNEEHNILSSGLPASLQSDIKTSYAGYWITDLKEEGEGKHAKYTLTLENADQVIHLRAGKEDNWEVVSTSVKVD
jgi:hypothetical protein